ncbi:GNAT family N-acetyltransferase [Paenibacillus sp. EC2-1]|uniref:GNAT family N-acetyltransferase n=1 Tax=Paenibacillus sp. EC2-1 TaxID=3388665 RepID=UPI003BEEDB2F
MKIRRFQDEDINQIVNLFYDTVHSVNKKDYTIKQLNVWAPPGEQVTIRERWRESMHRNITLVALVGETIVGFSDMTINGHLDRLYIHKDYLKQGIATALVHNLENEARKLKLAEIDTEASITAKPFFERKDYKVIHKQSVERSGILLTNYIMIKSLLS